MSEKITDDGGAVFLAGMLSRTMSFTLMVYGGGQVSAADISRLIQKLEIDRDILEGWYPAAPPPPLPDTPRYDPSLPDRRNDGDKRAGWPNFDVDSCGDGP